jgi:hypothetical protein
MGNPHVRSYLRLIPSSSGLYGASYGSGRALGTWAMTGMLGYDLFHGGTDAMSCLAKRLSDVWSSMSKPA